MAQIQYSEKLIELFRNPRNMGEIEGADAVGEVGNPSCGDMMTMFLKIDRDTDTILDIKVKTFGCAAAIATSSALTEMIKGKTLDEALAVSKADVAEYLGGLPPLKMHCSMMATDALENAVANYRNEDRTTHSNLEELYPEVDDAKCTGCGLCAQVAEDIFEMGEDDKSHVKKSFNESREGVDLHKMDEAAASCPEGAITLKKLIACGMNKQ